MLAPSITEQLENIGAPMLPISEVSEPKEVRHYIVVKCPNCPGEELGISLDSAMEVLEMDKDCPCILGDELNEAIDLYFNGEPDPDEDYWRDVDDRMDSARDMEFEQ